MLERDLFERLILDALILRRPPVRSAAGAGAFRRGFDPDGVPLNRTLAEVYDRLDPARRGRRSAGRASSTAPGGPGVRTEGVSRRHRRLSSWRAPHGPGRAQGRSDRRPATGAARTWTRPPARPWPPTRWSTPPCSRAWCASTLKARSSRCWPAGREVSPDGLTYAFHLRRRGRRFQDGTAFDASIVKFSLERAIAPNSTNVQKQALSVIRRVEVVDPRTVRLHLSSPDSNLLLHRPGRQRGWSRRSRWRAWPPPWSVVAPSSSPAGGAATR
ncbi:ABC transporter substrate-binding protein [Caulobacter segnis]